LAQQEVADNERLAHLAHLNRIFFYFGEPFNQLQIANYKMQIEENCAVSYLSVYDLISKSVRVGIKLSRGR
jgi:hypothetical protein